MELISRTHINKNSKNDWEELSMYLKEDLREIEDTKAVFEPKDNLLIIKRKLENYNSKFNTDFSLE